MARRAGELLQEMEHGKPGPQPELPNSLLGNSGYQQAIDDANINAMQAHRWRTIAKLPEETFERHIIETKADGDKELTSAGMLRLARAVNRENGRTDNTPVSSRVPRKLPKLFIGHAENMHFLEDESVDLIITSPPYNLGADNMPMGGDGRIPRIGGIGYADSLPEGEYQRWQLECLQEMYRVAKVGASLFYNHKVRNESGRAIHPLEWIGNTENPWILRQEIVWDRGSTHNHNPYLFWPEDERIYWMTKGKPELPDKPVGMSTIWRFHGPIVDTWHPAPFSDELPKRCLEAIGRDDITVLDPFTGSCTTLKVALELGYDAIGVDISAEYLEKAKVENGWITESVT